MNEGLPKGWLNIRLEQVAARPTQDIVDGPFGSNLKASEYVDSGVPIVRLQNIDRNVFINKNIHFVTPEKAAELSRHSYLPGDLLITKLGDPVAKACLVPSTLQGGVIVADVVRARIDERLAVSQFVAYAINSPSVIAQINLEVKGSTRPRVNLGHIRSLEIPLPPLPEQRRIVAKLEALLAKVDASRKRLERIPIILKRFRQAVLAAACDGRLTEDWRGSQGGNESCELDDLPPGWAWKPIDDLIPRGGIFDGPFGSNLKTSDYTDSGVRVIRLENVGNLRFVAEKETFISEAKFETLRRHTIYPGDIIFGSFVDESTRVCIVPQLPTQIIAKADCFCIRPSRDLIRNEFLATQLASSESRDRLLAEVHGATRPRVNTSQLRALKVRLCPLPEQDEILHRLRNLFAFADQIEARYAKAKAQVDRLTQSILAKAFRGELVPQDPNDEPADVLLSRLAAAPSEAPTPARRRSRPSQVEVSLPKVQEAGLDLPGTEASATPTTEESQQPQDPETWDPDAVMAAFRLELSRRARWDSDEEFLRAMARRFGFQRLGSRIKEALKGYLRKAIHRGIAQRGELDGALTLGARTLESYEQDFLLACISSLIRKGQAMGREEFMRALLHHLGFQRLTDAQRNTLKSLLNSAIRRGLLEAVGVSSVRRSG